MKSDEFRQKKSRSERVQNLKEFQMLINNILEDNVITIEETVLLKDALEKHRILEGDFADTFAIIEKVQSEQTINRETEEALYASLLDCLRVLRTRR